MHLTAGGRVGDAPIPAMCENEAGAAAAAVAEVGGRGQSVEQSNCSRVMGEFVRGNDIGSQPEN